MLKKRWCNQHYFSGHGLFCECCVDQLFHSRYTTWHNKHVLQWKNTITSRALIIIIIDKHLLWRHLKLSLVKVLPWCGNFDIKHFHKLMSKWLVGLGVWFSLWVREVPGSNPGRALEFFQSFAWRSFFWHLFSHNAVQNLEEVRFFLENRSQPSFVLIGFLKLWQVSLRRTSVRVKLLLLSCRQGNVKVTIKSKIKEEAHENFPRPILSIEEMFQIHSEWILRMQRYFSKQRWYDTKQVFFRRN